MTASRNQIISDARVLTADYLPNKLVHRDGERQEIARNLRPLMDDDIPTDMLLHGPPGTGKTAMAKYVVEELQKEVFVNTSYVNCFSHKSRFEIFYELLDEKLKVPRDSTSTEKVIEKFEEKVRKRPTIIIIDEVDQITEDEVLYELSRFQKAGIIFIANDANTFSHFEDRVRSRISGVNRIRFKRYSKQQLTDILKLRRKHGLREDSVKTSQLKKIASKAGGDARVAVNTLRLAARKAESKGLETITDEIIKDAVNDAYDEEELESLERLNSHQKKAYKLLQENGPMQIGELYDKYEDDVNDSKSRRQLLRYLKKMVSYNILETEGSKSSTTYSIAE
ncbi:Cdc6/Cdc18 family protein [Candidatus Nanosalina sp. VS9-1]|uniref:Cdc6/Cdc18 family protein n=1 Tax=Candidatus Nanosalina sp. VS9-1 TaxID=3388566 RepID=UPI0039E11D9A